MSCIELVMSVSVALGEMDSWVEEEIARELEKMGIEDIESIEEEEILDHSIDHALPVRICVPWCMQPCI